jgi:hypothetical protein
MGFLFVPKGLIPRRSAAGLLIKSLVLYLSAYYVDHRCTGDEQKK